MFYRRAKVASGTYFFTVNLAERKRTLLVEHVDLLRAVVQKIKSGRRMDMMGFGYCLYPSYKNCAGYGLNGITHL